MTKLGLTGTAKGMTRTQKAVFRAVITTPGWYAAVSEFHHGDCIGSDEEGHKFFREDRPTVQIIGHPPIVNRFRAFTECDREWTPKDYIPRNHDIVDEIERLVATPKGFKEELRSGTWATLRYARKLGKRFLIIWPDGATSRSWS